MNHNRNLAYEVQHTLYLMFPEIFTTGNIPSWQKNKPTEGESNLKNSLPYTSTKGGFLCLHQYSKSLKNVYDSF